MRNLERWTFSILKWGLVFGALGLLSALAALLLPMKVIGEGIKQGFLPGVSFLLVGLGIVSIAQYLYMRRHRNTAAQIALRERDERINSIRFRAGYRAFQLSSSLGFAVLIWSALAGSVGLPTFSHEGLWFAFLAVVCLSYIVYVAGIVHAETHG